MSFLAQPPVPIQTVGLLVLSNVFMTFALVRAPEEPVEQALVDRRIRELGHRAGGVRAVRGALREPASQARLPLGRAQIAVRSAARRRLFHLSILSRAAP